VTAVLLSFTLLGSAALTVAASDANNTSIAQRSAANRLIFMVLPPDLAGTMGGSEEPPRCVVLVTD
jgi:hypothetical protein